MHNLPPSRWDEFQQDRTRLDFPTVTGALHFMVRTQDLIKTLKDTQMSRPVWSQLSRLINVLNELREWEGRLSELYRNCLRKWDEEDAEITAEVEMEDDEKRSATAVAEAR